jgi:hypothetical protein
MRSTYCLCICVVFCILAFFAYFEILSYASYLINKIGSKLNGTHETTLLSVCPSVRVFPIYFLLEVLCFHLSVCVSVNPP